MSEPQILIVRTSALGDVVHSLPVLSALRRHLPRARIGWVVEEAMAPLLAGHPDLDELFVVRLRPWRRQPFARATLGEIAGTLAALRRFAPDIVLDLMGNHKAGVLGLASLARRRIGPIRHQRREPSSALWINEGVVTRGTHAVDRALSLLDALDLPPGTADFGGEKLFRGQPAGGAGPFSAGRVESAANDADSHPSGSRFFLIHPGASWPNKRYPAVWWGEVARRLKSATGLSTRIATATGQEGLAEEAAAHSGGAARVVPAPDLPSLACLLRRASLALGCDSGPLHLAHALGTPVLMVMGPTDPARHGPYGAPERALAVRLSCSYCYRRFAEAKACLLQIPPRRVAARAAELLSEATPDPTHLGGDGGEGFVDPFS